MRWEFDIIFRLGKWALLRRIDDHMTKTSKRWAIGLRRPYHSLDGKTYQSWGCWRELV